MSENARPPAKQENLFINLAFNVVIPVLILSKLSKPEYLGPVAALIIALVFPLGYGIYDYVQRRKTNVISILGFVSVLLTGGFGLMKLDSRWFAIKEAGIPALIGLGMLFSMRAKEPLIKTLFFNEAVLNLPKVDAALTARGTRDRFDALLRQCTLIISAAFFVSAALNYFLARHIVHSEGGTPEFNEELGRMHWISMLVISVPFGIMMMLAFWRLIRGLKLITGLTTDELIGAEPPKKESQPS